MSEFIIFNNELSAELVRHCLHEGTVAVHGWIQSGGWGRGGEDWVTISHLARSTKKYKENDPERDVKIVELVIALLHCMSQSDCKDH